MATILVTGSNRGIGLAICRQLHDRGDDVIATCRQTSEALDALGVRVEEGVDVTSDAAIIELSERLGETRLDGLVLNAGILERQSLDQLDFDGMRRQFEVNALGPLRVAAALAPRILPHGRIAIVTSRMGSIGDNTSGGSYGYRMSKAAVNMVGRSLAVDLRNKQVAVALLHPGWVRTDMTGHSGHVDPEHAARGLIARFDALTLETSGSFWHAQGDPLPW